MFSQLSSQRPEANSLYSALVLLPSPQWQKEQVHSGGEQVQPHCPRLSQKEFSTHKGHTGQTQKESSDY